MFVVVRILFFNTTNMSYFSFGIGVKDNNSKEEQKSEEAAVEGKDSSDQTITEEAEE